jgi:hypothetical protein
MFMSLTLAWLDMAAGSKLSSSSLLSSLALLSASKPSADVAPTAAALGSSASLLKQNQLHNKKVTRNWVLVNAQAGASGFTCKVSVRRLNL